MQSALLKQNISEGALDELFVRLYGSKEVIVTQRARYISSIIAFEALYGVDRDIEIFSAPGRTEVSGNHTDHQLGRVLAASVDLDAIAVVARSDRSEVRISSAGFSANRVELDDLAPRAEESTHSNSLVRGIASRMQFLGYRIGGFDAYTTSSVLKGSGLSSSAAFEVLVGTIFNHLFNGGAISPVEIAKIGQYAENEYFGKPSGLMDQTASSVGSFVAIDFANPRAPKIEQISFDFAASGYALCIVDTGGSHSDLTDAYASMPAEMRQVAALFGKEVLSQVEPACFYASLGKLRGRVSDRALLRAMHFYAENERVPQQAEALRNGDLPRFLQLVIESGRSSYMYLQNAYHNENPHEQGLSLALAISEQVLSGHGAWRVHGGGIAGTIQAFVPQALLAEYIARISAVFGEQACHVVSIRPCGAIRVIG